MLEAEAGEQEGVAGGGAPQGILHIQGQETSGHPWALAAAGDLAVYGGH